MIQIPADAKVIRHAGLTVVRTVTTLHEKHVNGEGGLKDKIKAAMIDKGAHYAESELVVARLQSSPPKSRIDPAKVFALVKAKKITLQDFLGCITVQKAAIAKLVAPNDLETMTQLAPDSETSGPVLYTEFKPIVAASLNYADVGNFIGTRLAEHLGQLTAAK